MPSYKALGSVAQDFVHSFFSLMNYCEGDYVIKNILAIATQQGISKLTIDVLHQKLDPPQFAIAPKSLHSQIRSFVWVINRHSYTCHAKIVDDRGKLHQKIIWKWWRY
jgi:hypothetical protein